MRFFKFFDLFGTSFTTTEKLNDKPASILGGMMGVIYIAAACYFSYYFSNDFFQKDNPVLLREDVEKYPW